eukprot:scaffold1390_cov138-Cylindrotheca_fusiformis.AAC.25
MEVDHQSIQGNDTCFQHDGLFDGKKISLDDIPAATAAGILFFAVAAFFSTREILKKRKKPFATQRPVHDSVKMKRKKEFLFRVGDAYGYNGTKGGFIDDWRPKELPYLQTPILSDSIHDADGTEREVYLDYAGSGLPTKSQLEQVYHAASTTAVANPHSTGPAASRALLGIEQAKAELLNRFHAAPGRFASLNQPPATLSERDRHSGYEVLFTSGTTEALRIVAERFPWRRRCNECGRQSIFLYAQNSHTSVLGMRELALRHGARFHCRTMEEIEEMNKESLISLEKESMTAIDKWKNCSCCENNRTHNLLAFPAECNFGGNRPNSKSIIQVARECGWFTMLDVAKAVSTGPVDFCDENPDFGCMSFYKLFGAPTGLGALFVKRSSLHALFQTQQQRHYAGGGSVNIMLSQKDFISQSNNLSSLSNGSCHFRGILQLYHGFKEIDRRGGMSRIHQHTTTLAKELHRRLKALLHGNGRPVVTLYGAWAKDEKAPGPTIAMNILREDGSVVGYNEVSKLAALHKPAIQFRTGCFCNPGACQESLGQTDEKLIHNFEVGGHVCGDHIDIVNGEPTGAIRISFGKDSIWEDLDEFVLFVERTFLSKDPKVGANESATSAGPVHVALTELYVFPIKSCAAQRVSGWRIDFPSGKLSHDREFALVDASGTALRLQNYPKMGRINPRINLEKQLLTVSAPGCEDLVLSLNYSESDCAGNNEVSVCGNKCGGQLWGGWKASEWFSAFLGVQCWLARYSEASVCRSKPVNGFANDQPLLLISGNAVQALNEVLLEQKQNLVGSKHFRPNMVVQSNGAISHIEDEWHSLVLKKQGVTFEVKGECARCSMVDYDPLTGNKGKTLRALAKYRRRKGQITFGIFLRAVASGDDVTNGIWINEGEVLLGS